METSEDFLVKIEDILGARIGQDGTLSLRCQFNNYEEARAELHRVRRSQKELRALKRQINQICKEIRAEYTSKRTMVGKGVGSGLAAGFFGRKAVGSYNALKRDDLRREKDAELAPYEDLKHTVDNIVHNLDEMKHKIEMSDEYANKPQKGRAKKDSAIKRKKQKFFAHLSGEVRGPFDELEIGALLKAASIDATTLLCSEGEEDWHPVSHFFEV